MASENAKAPIPGSNRQQLPANVQLLVDEAKKWKNSRERREIRVTRVDEGVWEPASATCVNPSHWVRLVEGEVRFPTTKA